MARHHITRKVLRFSLTTTTTMHLTPMTWNWKSTTIASLHQVDPPLPTLPLIHLCPRTRTFPSIAHTLTQDPTVPRPMLALHQCLPLIPSSFRLTHNKFVHSLIHEAEGLPWPTLPMSLMSTQAIPIIRHACLAPCHRLLLTTSYRRHRPTQPVSLVAPPDVSHLRFFTQARITHHTALPAPPAFLPKA